MTSQDHRDKYMQEANTGGCGSQTRALTVICLHTLFKTLGLGDQRDRNTLPPALPRQSLPQRGLPVCVPLLPSLTLQLVPSEMTFIIY